MYVRHIKPIRNNGFKIDIVNTSFVLAFGGANYREIKTYRKKLQSFRRLKQKNHFNEAKENIGSVEGK